MGATEVARHKSVEPEFEKKDYVSGNPAQVKEQVTQGGRERFESASHRAEPPQQGCYLRDRADVRASFMRLVVSRLDGELELSEHLDGAGLPALEITGGKALARSELISRAQDCFRRVTALLSQTRSYDH